MNRTSLNFWVDALAAVLFLGMILTGLILEFALPPGTNKLYTLWTLSRHAWGEVHSIISLGLIGVLAVHVSLHWQWITSLAAKRFGRSTKARTESPKIFILVMGLVAAAVGLFSFVAAQSVKETVPHCPRSAANGSSNSETAEPCAATPTSHEPRAALTILESQCAGCHTAARPRGGFDATRKEDYFTDRPGGALVIPGRSDRSAITSIIMGNRGDLPYADRHRLSPSEAAVVRSWIDEGAAWVEKDPS